MTYAGIKNGIVVQLFTPQPAMEEIDPMRLFHPSLFDDWVKIDGINPPPQSGWTYDGKSFSPPPPAEDIAARRAWAAKAGYRV